MFLYFFRLRTAGVILALIFLAAAFQTGCRQAPDQFDVEGRYLKREVRIPMRDGVHLYAAVYIPRDTSETYPFLIKKSPYSSGPYGADAYPSHLGPNGNDRFAEEGYIFVYQDVRGRFMSEGRFVNMTPDVPQSDDSTAVDESTDMYDTVDWLLENVRPNNGRAGIWGISYPGFYAAASIVDSHPAIKAASPQAPISDWFIDDDFHHQGAFYLQDAFNFFSFFESPDPNPTDHWGDRQDFGSDDAYRFYLDLGPLKNANERYFHGEIAFWDSLMQHGEYDRFWQTRNINPDLYNVTASVMTVGGFYDAEDPYGPVAIYQSIEEKNPGIDNRLVLGPWFHGGWVRSAGDHLGNVNFGQATSEYYQEAVDIPFFNFYLKDKGTLDLPEVLAYATGSNEWHRFDSWPPAEATETNLYFGADGSLSFSAPTNTAFANDSYESDPDNPVPYTKEKRFDRTREYMVEDQRFVSERTDVLVYETDVLSSDYTFAGPITPHLWVSTTGTDADFVVKLIDVFPDDEPEWQTPEEKYLDDPMGGYQMLVRGEPFRARFRNSFSNGEAMAPETITEISFETPHVFHTFKAGHRIMIQVQSSWFPLVDRNPQTFVDIYSADESDFRAATERIYRSTEYPSHVTVGRIK